MFPQNKRRALKQNYRLKVYKTTKNEIATGIKKGHFAMDASENYSKIPPQNPELDRNQLINLLCKSIDWFLHNTSLYRKIFAKKKKKKNQLNRSRIQSPTKNPRQCHFQKNSQRLKPFKKSILGTRHSSEYDPLKSSV